MIHTVEDSLEILAGLVPRSLNIRLDYNEKTIIRSLGRQVSNRLALTDRQLDLVLKKLEKYRDGLERNGVDVDNVLQKKPLRMPLREIDRSQRVSIVKTSAQKETLVIKFNYSKKFTEIWSEMQEKIIGTIVESGQQKELLLTETNVFHAVGFLQSQEFDIDEEVLEIYEKIEKIWENPMTHVPYIDIEQDKIVVKNANKNLEDYLNLHSTTRERKSFLAHLDELKHCGIYHKSSKIIEKIHDANGTALIKNIVLDPATRFRINPENCSFKELLPIIESLDQWPVLILVEEDQRVLQTISTMYNALSTIIDNKNMNVFFRLDNGQPHHQEFNQFVRDKGLNNYIDSQTKIVFISKNRIPKPLMKADWKPKTAIVVSGNDFGKTSAFLDDIPTVYYYNNSVSLRHNRLKGARSIVQL